MTITSVLNTAVTGLMTSQTGLRITSNNIANVNTEDYSREIIGQENIVVTGDSVGVRVTGVQRVVDRFLQAAGFDANSGAFEADVKRQFHDRLQGLIGRPDGQSNIAARLNTIFTRFADLELDPSQPILRMAALSSMQNFADEISRISQSIQDLRNDANQQILEQVERANEAIRRIHELNPEIVRQTILKSETAGLENQRDQALNDLAEILDISVSHQDNGAIWVTTSTGVVLLDSARRELEYNPTGTVTSETVFRPIQIHRTNPTTGERTGTPRDFDPDVSAGKLRALLDLRDKDLRNLSLSLGELAAAFINEFNAVHNSLTAIPAPNELISRQTVYAGTHLMNMSGETTFAIVDANNQVVASTSYDFTANPGATWDDLAAAVTAGLGGAGTLSFAGGVMTFTATDPSHGVVLADDPTNTSNRGGQNFSQFFAMNDLLTAPVRANYANGILASDTHLAASGLLTFELRDAKGAFLAQYTLDPSAAGPTYGDILTALNDPAALGNYLNFSLDANGQLVVQEQPGFDGARLSVLTDTTDMNSTGITLSKFFGLGDRYLVDPSKNLRVLDSILEQPSNLALFSFDRSALVGEAGMLPGDQSGTLAYQALETSIFGFDAAGELGGMSASLGQYAAAVLSNAGLMAERARSRAEDTNALLAEVETRIGDVSGVNLDEELSNMIVLQTAYNASARVITTSQEIINVLFDAVR